MKNKEEKNKCCNRCKDYDPCYKISCPCHQPKEEYCNHKNCKIHLKENLPKEVSGKRYCIMCGLNSIPHFENECLISLVESQPKINRMNMETNKMIMLIVVIIMGIIYLISR